MDSRVEIGHIQALYNAKNTLFSVALLIFYAPHSKFFLLSPGPTVQHSAHWV